MNRPRLVAAALVIGVVLTGQAGAALADDPAPTPAAQPSGTTSGDDTAAVGVGVGEPEPQPEPSPSAGPNQPPATAPDAASVYAGRSVTEDVLANDTDPDGSHDDLTLTAVDDPRAKIVGNEVTFTAGSKDSGTVTVTYTVSDGTDQSTGTLTVTVKKVPAASVTLDVPDRIVALRKHTMKGRALPTVLGRATVTLQRRKGDSWVGLGKDKAGAQGYWSVPFRTNRPVTYVFRAKAVWPDGRVRFSGTHKRVVKVVADPHVSGPLTRSQVPWSYRSGCPVPPRDLRKVTINRIDYRHLVARGTLVVRASRGQADGVGLHRRGEQPLPGEVDEPDRPLLRRRQPHPHRVRRGGDARRQHRGVQLPPGDRQPLPDLAALLRQRHRHQHDRRTPTSPAAGSTRPSPREYLDRSPYRKGMILARRRDRLAGWRQLGWPWGARWSHPDYQHFSSNGGLTAAAARCHARHMTEQTPPPLTPAHRGLGARCSASSRTPTTWSSARPPRSPAGPARASRSSTAWSPAARPASTACTPTSAARSARPSRSSPRASSASPRSTSSACPTASWSTASRCAGRSPRWYDGTGPDIVITNNFRDTWGGRNLNQADHIATGKATLDAVRDAGNRWVFREHVEGGGLEPWGGVKQVWAAGSPQSDGGVDITDTFDAGVESLRAHRAYIDGLGWEDFDPAEFLEGMSRATGQRLGVAHAVGFEVFPMGWGD